MPKEQRSIKDLNQYACKTESLSGTNVMWEREINRWENSN